MSMFSQTLTKQGNTQLYVCLSCWSSLFSKPSMSDYQISCHRCHKMALCEAPIPPTGRGPSCPPAQINWMHQKTRSQSLCSTAWLVTCPVALRGCGEATSTPLEKRGLCHCMTFTMCSFTLFAGREERKGGQQLGGESHTADGASGATKAFCSQGGALPSDRCLWWGPSSLHAGHCPMGSDMREPCCLRGQDAPWSMAGRGQAGYLHGPGDTHQGDKRCSVLPISHAP